MRSIRIITAVIAKNTGMRKAFKNYFVEEKRREVFKDEREER